MQPRIDGTPANDELIGTDGSETMKGLDGDDLINGGDGYDVLLGGAGNDSLIGGPSFDLLDGGEGNDNLLGSGWLYGGEGADIISSTRSALLRGDGGADLLTGAAGFDRFFFDVEAGDSDPSNPDTIRFFQEGTDKIVLDIGLGADGFRQIQPLGDGTFDEFIDSVESAGIEAIGQFSGDVLMRVENNVLEIDNDFDGEADLAVAFTQDVDLSADDLILI